MSEERKIQLIDIPIKLLIIVFLAWLYSYSGLHGTEKYWRRFVAPSICGATLFFFTRDWRSLIVAPLLAGASSIGYGASDIWVRIFKRLYVGLAFGLSANAYNFFKNNRAVIVYTTLLIVCSFVFIGVWNFLPNARYEETFLGLIIYSSVLLSSK